ILAMSSGALGVLLAIPGVAVLQRGLGLWRIGLTATVDHRVLIFAFATAAFVGIGCGVAPARRATGAALDALLRAHASASSGRGRIALNRFVVLMEVATAVVVLGTTALLSRSLFQLLNRGLGFDGRDVYHLTTRMPPSWTSDSGRRREFA